MMTLLAASLVNIIRVSCYLQEWFTVCDYVCMCVYVRLRLVTHLIFVSYLSAMVYNRTAGLFMISEV